MINSAARFSFSLFEGKLFVGSGYRWGPFWGSAKMM